MIVRVTWQSVQQQSILYNCNRVVACYCWLNSLIGVWGRANEQVGHYVLLDPLSGIVGCQKTAAISLSGDASPTWKTRQFWPWLSISLLRDLGMELSRSCGRVCCIFSALWHPPMLSWRDRRQLGPFWDLPQKKSLFQLSYQSMWKRGWVSWQPHLEERLRRCGWRGSGLLTIEKWSQWEIQGGARWG
jgi:hypothetical protein